MTTAYIDTLISDFKSATSYDERERVAVAIRQAFFVVESRATLQEQRLVKMHDVARFAGRLLLDHGFHRGHDVVLDMANRASLWDQTDGGTK